jgi:MFS family permease
VFALASLGSGLAGTAAELIAARAVQGIGGAAMYATTIALLNSAYQGRDRGVAFGVWGAVSGAAAAAGPILGGLLTQSLSWRWIFFVNLPVSVAAIAATWRAIAADRPGARPRLDVAGLVTFTAGAGAVTYGLIRTSAAGWTSWPTAVALGLGAVAFVLFAVAERRAAAPLLDLGLLRRPAVAGVMAAALLLSAAAFAYLPYSSLWLQSVLRLGPVRAGLLGSLPLSLASFTVSVLVGRFLHAANPRWIVGGGLGLIGAGALIQAAMIGSGSDQLALIPGLLVAGTGVGLATPTLVSNAMAAVPQRSGGMAAGAVNTARQLGFTFGVALLGSVFAAQVARRLGQAQTVLGHGAGPGVQAATAGGLGVSFLIAGLLGLAGAVIAAVTMRRPVPESDTARVAGRGAGRAVVFRSGAQDDHGAG